MPSSPRSDALLTARSSTVLCTAPFATRWTLPVFFSNTRKSLAPMKAIVVGCDKPVTTVFTERFGSSIDGPAADGGFTVVCRLAELLPGFGSFSVAVTLAILLSWAGPPKSGDCGRITMLTFACAPIDIAPRLQVTVVVPVHKPWLGVDEIKLMPGGKVSVTMTFVAGEGPLLVTAIRYVIFARADAGFGDAVFVKARSALGVPETMS